MNNNKIRIFLEDEESEFHFKKNKSNLDISFNRIAFIFFIFFVVSLIYSIHLFHLGSKKQKSKLINYSENNINKLYRADIVDRNNRYLVKTINSIDIGISPSKIINEKKLIIKKKYLKKIMTS